MSGFKRPALLMIRLNHLLCSRSIAFCAVDQSLFVQSINRFESKSIEDIVFHLDCSKKETLRSIRTKRNQDMADLKFSSSLIAKSLGYGAFGGLAVAQIATQMAFATAFCTTPAGWIGGTGTPVIYYSTDKRDQTKKLR